MSIVLVRHANTGLNPSHAGCLALSMLALRATRDIKELDAHYLKQRDASGLGN